MSSNSAITSSSDEEEDRVLNENAGPARRGRRSRVRVRSAAGSSLSTIPEVDIEASSPPRQRRRLNEPEARDARSVQQSSSTVENPAPDLLNEAELAAALEAEREFQRQREQMAVDEQMARDLQNAPQTPAAQSAPANELPPTTRANPALPAVPSAPSEAVPLSVANTNHANQVRTPRRATAGRPVGCRLRFTRTNVAYDGSPCSICLVDAVTDPIACRFCKKCVGCFECVQEWCTFKPHGNMNRRSCPLCRRDWGNKPQVLEMTVAELLRS